MKLTPAIGLIIVLAIVAFPIFGFIGYLPIRLWDESRVAVNAYEMSKTGSWIVTTYQWLPDMWNTKPPLLIWLQAISLKLFGYNDMSIRMVSPVAALITCIFIYWFAAKKCKQPWLGIIACFVLITSKGYIRLHGARSGEYDALLVMFTTMYVLFYFLYLEENRTKYLYAVTVTLIFAALTKGIAALLFLPALLLYTLLQKKGGRLLRSPHFYISLVLFLVFAGGYYLLREHYNPGYIEHVRYNEFGGRYMQSTQEAKYNNDIFYYYRFLRGNTFIRWMVFMFAGSVIGLTSKDAIFRRLTLYSVLASFSYFIIISLGRTKNEWYDLAAYPFFAIITATGIFIICRLLLKIPVRKYYINYALVVIFIALISWLPYMEIIMENRNPPSEPSAFESDNIGFYMRDVLRSKRNPDGAAIASTGYQAVQLWYRYLLKEAGRSIDTIDYKTLPAQKKVIAYQEEVKNYIATHYNVDIADTFNAVTVYHINGTRQ